MSREMRIERGRYIQSRGTAGGTASGFRDWVRAAAETDPKLFPYDALRDDAATKAWEEQPRRKGPDLFSIAGVPVPEFLTRTKKGYLEAEDTENEDAFEKVGQQFATVADRFEDAVIKMRKAAQASASAEQDMRQADEARRRARGDVTARLLDLADPQDRRSVA